MFVHFKANNGAQPIKITLVLNEHKFNNLESIAIKREPLTSL